MSIPLTRPLSLTIHEPVYPLVITAAEEDHKGNISDYVRTVIYLDLVRRGILNGKLIKEIG